MQPVGLNFSMAQGGYMRSIVCVLSLALLTGIMPLGRAQSLPESCKASFNVKNKSFSTGNATMSCRLVEARRVEMTTRILETPDTGEIDGAAVAKKLDQLDAEIKKQQDAKNWLGLGNTVTGVTLATIGLGACLTPPVGAGCALAAVGKLMAMHSLFDAASSENDKAKQAAAMRAHIASIRTAVVGKKSEAKRVRDALINDASAMCMAVKNNCL
jgi:hypothetical protein